MSSVMTEGLMTDRTFVVAGCSIAGVTAARELRRGGFDGRLVMLDRDDRAPYRRPEVSKGLLGYEINEEKVAMPWPSSLGAERIPGAELTGLDLDARVITAAASGQELEIAYDGLVIATGCESRPAPFTGPVPVHALRSYADAERFRGELARAQHLVVVGAGFIGLEVAAGAAALGKQVTVVEPMPLPLAHVLGPELSTRLLEMHEGHGITFRLQTHVTELEAATGSGARVLLADGTAVEADLILVAVGARPAVDWLAGSGLDVERGVICDSTCAVAGTTDVVAAGDVALWENPLYGRVMRVEHWANAIEQGSYAARRLLGTHDPNGFTSAPYFWSDQHGRKIQSIGSTVGFDDAEVLDDDPESFVVAYYRDDRLLAVAGLVTGPVIPRFKPLVLAGAGRADVAAQYAPPVRKVS
jgi:NADPH-dependent 2,4-dienoyl-CoA reductase/sulfur reductase-like enzyme